MNLPTAEHPRLVVQGDVLDILGKLEDQSVSMIYTDPDYGVPVPDGIGGLTTDPEWVATGTLSDDYLQWFDRWVAEAARVLTAEGSLVCWTNQELTTLETMRRHLIWRRNLYFCKTNAAPRAVLFPAVEVAAWLTKGRGPYRRATEASRTPQWFVDNSNTDRWGHPTSKKVSVVAYHLEMLTQPGDLVVDPFCGSGSIGVAAISLGRRYLGSDIDPRWVATTRERLAAM